MNQITTINPATEESYSNYPIMGKDEVVKLVDNAKNKGVKIPLGGSEIDRKGFYNQPTILTNVKPDMRIVTEETFGPRAHITLVDDENDAISLANYIRFGLGVSIWTEGLKKAKRLSRKIESGIVSVNNVVISDPRIPFGGIRQSGFGRELSRYGMLEFVNIKSVRFYDQLIHHHYVE